MNKSTIYFFTTNTMHKISNLYEDGDIKYYRRIHCDRQQSQWNTPVTYEQFRRRLDSGMTLRDAIYTPSNTHMCRKRRSHMNREEIRKAKLIEENVQMGWAWLDHVFKDAELDEEFEKLWNEMFKEEQKKPSLIDRFISFFK